MSLSDLWSNVQAILPLVVLMAWACLLLLVDQFIPQSRKGWTAVLACLGLVVAFVLLVIQPSLSLQQTSALNGMVTIDGFARFMQGLFLISGIAGIFLAYDYLKRIGLHQGEYYVLLLFSIGGMMSMSMVSDLIMVFLSLEWLSIPLYVLSGFARPKEASEESALKYFLLGAYSAGFVLYGTALSFGATGTTSLAGIVSAIQSGHGPANNAVNLAMLAIGGALILVGLGFKVSVVPFHMWTPDVYQGAPSSVTGFMAVTAKAAGFAALLRVFTLAFPAVAADLTPVLWALAALTMFLGNVVAIAQSSIKRMLAYSSIAHAGYILMALVPYGNPAVASDSIASGLFYLLAYGVTTFGAWAVVIALEKAGGGDYNKDTNLDDYAGMGKKYPALAACMTVFMLSFTGVPPTLGFVGKLYLFRTVIEGGLVGLAIIGVLTSLVSAYYYLRVVVIMYMRDGNPTVRSEGWLNLTIAASAAVVVVFSLFSAPLFQWAAGAIVR